MTNYLEAKGWLTGLERETLKYLAESMSPPCTSMINIGIEYGASIHCLRAGEEDGIIFAVDIIGNEKFEGEIDKRVLFYKQTSGSFFEWIKEKEILKPGLVFVDGDHGYNGVTIDCQFADLVGPNGFIVFHDCYSWEDPTQVHKLCPGVNAAVQDWFDAEGEGRFTELESKDSMRIFQRTT